MIRPVGLGATLLAIPAILVTVVPLGAQHSLISGTLLVMDRGDRQAKDVGQAVVWLEGGDSPAAEPDTATVLTEAKEFRPHVVVVTRGSSVSFPNNDPFNHNVFSLSPEGPFDLGLYGRTEVRTATFRQTGVVRVYCNVHATMSAFVVVVPNAHHTRPGADGSFRLEGVAPGRYTLKAWHERAGEPISQPISVTASGLSGVRLEMDARQFRAAPHLNKYGQPYRTTGRRY
jgi:plastocyanin